MFNSNFQSQFPSNSGGFPNTSPFNQPVPQTPPWGGAGTDYSRRYDNVPPVVPSISTIPGTNSAAEPTPFWGGADPTALPNQNSGNIGDSFSRRNDARLIPAPQNCSQTYELDAMERAWLEAKLVNGSVRKRTPLTTAFSIVSVISVIDPLSGDERYVLVTYCTDMMHTVAIPADDYRNGRLIQHFKEVRRLPGCTKRQANDLLEFLIGSVPSQTLILFPRQGFIRQNDGIRYTGKDNRIVLKKRRGSDAEYSENPEQLYRAG